MPVIQWFPGHMAKARRTLEENAPLVDVVLEIVDARCPLASRNPELMKLVAHKPQVLILNKADLAHPATTARWVAAFRQEGRFAVALDAVKGTGARDVLAGVKEAFAPTLAKWVEKGRKPRPARVMAVGIPNVGKSSAINRLVGARKAVVGDKPGVTRGKQWVRIGADVELLDMPGILVPRFEDQRDGILLAAIGAVKEEVFDQRMVAAELLPMLWERVPQAVAERFGLTALAPDPEENLTVIGRHRGLLRAGETVEIEKAAALVLREFREGRLGRLSLQDPPEQ
ncbi:MAG: ribosome biogenesis GTPase YlqF [Bacillota bacterium]